MRYWKPFTIDVAAKVSAWNPDELILLPLYPQYSTTTTGSSINEWNRVYRGGGIQRTICCYSDQVDFVQAHVEKIRQAWENAGRPHNIRLLFCAHGLPQSIVDDGDPYPMQIEKTCSAVVAALGPAGLGDDWDWRLCYQSRVGRLKWLEPYTEKHCRSG